jgi:hypothetical protein
LPAITIIIGPSEPVSGAFRRGFPGYARRGYRLRAAWLRPKQTDLIPDRGQFRSRFHHPLSYCCPATIFLDTRNRHRHLLSATLLDGRAGNGSTGCYDAVAIARAAGFRMLVMSRIRHAGLRLGAGQKGRPKYPEKSLSDNSS